MLNNLLQRNITILYVEDDPTTYKLLCPMLEGQGYQVLLAKNGLEGLELFRRHLPDIILTDLKMPGMNGLEMAGIIRREAPAVQIIILTAFSDTDYLLNAIDIGINQFIRKPVEFTKLQAVITDCIKTIQCQQVAKEQSEHIHMLSKALEHSPSMFIITNTQGEIEYVNRKFSEVSGYTSDEVIGKTPRIIRSGDTDAIVYENLWATIMAGREWQGVLKNRGKNGNVFWVHGSISPLISAEGMTTKFIYSAKDITEQRRLEAESLKIVKLEANAILAGGMAHDFNNLLQVILGYISLAKQNTTPDNSASGLLNQAEKVSLRASQLSQQLLTFAKGGDTVLQIASLGQLITSSIEAALDKTNIKPAFHLLEDIPLVMIDTTQMKHVFSHLAVNAYEAMPDGGTLLIKAQACKISPSDGLPLKSGLYVHITFSDTGKGISKDNLGKIFDPYFTTKETWNQKGLGLGLAICNSVIRKHKGIITVNSKAGSGATFHVYLPASENPAASHESTAEGIDGTVNI